MQTTIKDFSRLFQDLLGPPLRAAVFACEMSSKTHSKLAFYYVNAVVLPELKRIAALSKERAAAEVDAFEREP